MARSLKNNLSFAVLIILLTAFFCSDSYSLTKSELQDRIISSLEKLYPASKIRAKVLSKSKSFTGSSASLSKLSIRMDNMRLGNIQSDFFTVILDDVKIDLNQITSKNRLKIKSYKSIKLRIGVSTTKMKESFRNKMHSMGKSGIEADFKYSPPYIECFYKVPESQLGEDTKAMLVKYIAGSNLEGYIAFRINAKKNNIYAHPEKVILNHFLLPGTLVGSFESIYNPFETLSVIRPFKYQIDKAEVQDKFIIFTN